MWTYVLYKHYYLYFLYCTSINTYRTSAIICTKSYYTSTTICTSSTNTTLCTSCSCTSTTVYTSCTAPTYHTSAIICAKSYYTYKYYHLHKSLVYLLLPSLVVTAYLTWCDDKLPLSTVYTVNVLVVHVCQVSSQCSTVSKQAINMPKVFG